MNERVTFMNIFNVKYFRLLIVIVIIATFLYLPPFPSPNIVTNLPTGNFKIQESVSDWFEDCENISDWTDARGTAFESNILGGPDPIQLTDGFMAFNGNFTPDNLWWNPPAGNTTSRRAAIYRELPTIWEELIINSTINFDPTSISNPYTFGGGLEMVITGPNFEALFQYQICDGASSSGVHQAYHRAWYFNSTGSPVEVLPLTLAASPVINQGRMTINITKTTINLFTPIVNDWIDLETDPDTAFERGSPTYLVLYGLNIKTYLNPPPISFNFESIEAITTSRPLVSDWFEDCENISDWTDARGTAFESNILGGPDPIQLTDGFVASNGNFTSDNLWWNPPAGNTTNRRAAIYQELPTIWEELIINSTINFDPTSISNPYTFSGGLEMVIVGPNFEALFQYQIIDGSSSSDAHQAYHRAWYFNSAGSPVEVLPLTFAASPVINHGRMTINITKTTINLFTPIINDWIDLETDPDIAFEQGFPTYLVLYGLNIKTYLNPPPTSLNWEMIETVTSFNDTTPPTVTISSPASTFYGIDTINISLTGDATNYWYYIGGIDSINQSWNADTLRTLADGTYTLHVYGNDSAGNVAYVNITFTIDITPPIVTIASPTNSVYRTNNINVSLTGNADLYWYYISGVDVNNQTWATDVTRTLADGSYVLHAYGADIVGNEVNVILGFTIDTTPPTLMISSPTSTNYNSNTINVSLIGDATNYWYYIEGIDVINQSWTADVIRMLADGTYTLHAYATDIVGNEAYVAVTFTIDTTPPIVIISNPLSTTYATNTITVSLTGDATNYLYYISGIDVNNQTWTVEVTRTLTDGTYTLYAYGIDNAGNTGYGTVVFTIEVSTTTTETTADTSYDSSITPSSTEPSSTSSTSPELTSSPSAILICLGVTLLFIIRRKKR